MTNSRKALSRTLNKRFAKKQAVLPRVAAEMGNGFGGLEVEGAQGYVYVLVNGKPEIVYNDRVPNDKGKAVWIGYSPEEPTKRQVLSTRSTSATGDERGYLGYAPAKRYEWHAPKGGQDPLWVHQRALTFLRISPCSVPPTTFEVYVHVFSGRIYSGTGWVTVAQQIVDVYEHIPTTAGKAAYVLFTINTSGAVVTTKGDEVDIDALALTDIPDAPANTAFISGAVRVYTGQTIVQEGRTNTDFVDLRFASVVSNGFNVLLEWNSILNKPDVFTPDDDYLLVQVTEDLTAQVDGYTDHFDIDVTTAPPTIWVRVNGLKEAQSEVALDSDVLGFTLSYDPLETDTLEVEYLADPLRDDDGKILVDDDGYIIVS